MIWGENASRDRQARRFLLDGPGNGLRLAYITLLFSSVMSRCLADVLRVEIDNHGAAR